MITEHQLPEKYREIVKKQLDKFKTNVFTQVVNEIPAVDKIPGEGSAKWLKIKDVICVFVDMKNSTKFSASHHASTTAKVYTNGTSLSNFFITSI